MFRKQWSQVETELESTFKELREEFFARIKPGKQKVEKFLQENPASFKEKKEEFLNWGTKYVQGLKMKSESERVNQAKEDFFVLLRNFGINDEMLRQTFNENRKELLDPVVGEAIAIISLILGWKEKDKEAFSQSLGEIGVVGVFAAKPFICLIAICGLAWGYQENFHSEAFKKGGVLGLTGFLAAAISPGGFVGLLAAIVTMIYFNKKLKVDRPIEVQLKEIFKEIRSGGFFKEVRQSWSRFEDYLSKILIKKNNEQDLTTN